MAKLVVKKLTDTLTGKQKAWLNHYFALNFNAMGAARAAGYQGTPSSLGVIGHENLKKLKLFVEQRMKEQQMSADEALARMSKIAATDATAYLKPMFRKDEYDYDEDDPEDDGDKLLGVVPSLDYLYLQGKAHIVKEVQMTKFGLKVKFHDAQKALEVILKVHGKLGPKGTEDDPAFNVEMSLDDWKKRAAQRRAKAEEKLD